MLKFYPHHIFFVPFFSFVFSLNTSYSQSIESAVINTTGNTFTNDEYIFDWSVGEMAIVETMANTKVILTNGFLQSLPPMFILTKGFSVKAHNILTPNYDGKNDSWIIKEIEKYPDNEVTVFNRQGNIVFKAKNYQNDWQGDRSGNPLPPGTYYYVISMKKNGENGLTKGFITILK